MRKKESTPFFAVGWLFFCAKKQNNVAEITNEVKRMKEMKTKTMLSCEESSTTEAGNKTFPIVGVQFCADDYLTSAGMQKMMSLLNSDEFEIRQIDGKCNTIAYFLISAELYDSLKTTEIHEMEAFIGAVLDDVEKESPDGEYTWRDHRMHLEYQ
jgi:hypothetical protein